MTNECFKSYVLLVAACVGAACTGASDTSAPIASTLVEMAPFTVAPGAQGMKCQTVKNPTGARIEIRSWLGQVVEGAHHLHVYLVDDPVEDDVHECPGTEFSLLPLLYASQSGGASELAYPEGIAAVVEANQGLMLRIHYLNSSDEDLVARNSVKIEYTAATTTARYVSPITLSNQQINIPPGGMTTIEKTCTVDRDIDLVWMISHMHDHGIGFVAKTSGSLMYEADSGEAPPRSYDPIWSLRAGDAVTFACTWSNTSSQTIRWGDSLTTDEMCNFRGAYVPSEPGAEGGALGCDGPMEGVCLACAPAFSRHARDAACADAKDAYDALRACACSVDGCAAECGATTCADQAPSQSCLSCLQTGCATQAAACFAG